MEDRRKEDERLKRLEEEIVYIRAKLDNGLSERTKTNTLHLEQLIEKQNQFEIVMYKEVAKTTAELETTRMNIGNLCSHLEDVTEEQRKWNQLLVRGLWTIITTGAFIAGFLVYHSGDIGVFIDHINSL